jgi:hypothetical protein
VAQGRVWLAALPLLLVHGGLTLVADLAAHLELTLVLVAVGFGALAWAARRLARLDAAPTAALLGVAVVLRLLLLPLSPSLSPDVERYVWDGRALAAGHNPYLLAPAAEELASLRDGLWQGLPHKEVSTVYPPFAMAVFTFAALSPWPVPTLKVCLTVAELLGAWALLQLVRRRGLPASRWLWYAWNPLVVIEVAGMGHVDGLGTALVVLGAWALGSGLAARGGLAVGLGVLAKLVPLCLVPVWARGEKRPWRFALAALGVAALGLVPLAVAVEGVPPGLVRYGVSWDFNGPLFEPAWRLLAAVEADRGVASWVDRLKELTGHPVALDRLYPLLYPQLLAKGILGLVALGLWWRAWRSGRGLAATLPVLGGLLLCSATLYPWYLLWVLPWAALAQDRAWLALSGLSFLSYLPQLTGAELWPGLFLVIWLPFWSLRLHSAFRARSWSNRSTG